MLRQPAPNADQTPAPPLRGLIGGSRAMLDVYATTRRVAATNASVLLLGETGTGKELIAKAIHELSPRGSGPFVRVNCGALSESLLESELFGHDEVARENFREDLYYRLNVVPIQLPPLRSRRDDIPLLVSHFLEHYNEQNDRYVVHIQKEALDALVKYHWPGNVRELQNVVERCVVMAVGDELTLDLLPPAMRGDRAAPAAPGRGGDLDSLARDLVEQGMTTAGPNDENLFDRIVSRVERELIAQMLAACGGVQLKAAARLGINRNTLRKKLQEHGLEDEA